MTLQEIEWALTYIDWNLRGKGWPAPEMGPYGLCPGCKMGDGPAGSTLVCELGISIFGIDPEDYLDKNQLNKLKKFLLKNQKHLLGKPQP